MDLYQGWQPHLWCLVPIRMYWCSECRRIAGEGTESVIRILDGSCFMLRN